MPFKNRLRAAISRSPTSSTTSTASSSTSDLSSSPLTTIPSTPTVGLTKATTTLTLASTTTTTSSNSNLHSLAKSPSSSRIRSLLTRPRTGTFSSSFKPSKSSSSAPKTEQQMIAEWHAYNGPKSRFRKHVDPLHRAQLEAWEWGSGRKGSVASQGALSPCTSPCASRAASLDLRSVAANEHQCLVEEVENA